MIVVSDSGDFFLDALYKILTKEAMPVLLNSRKTNLKHKGLPAVLTRDRYWSTICAFEIQERAFGSLSL